MDTQQCAGFLHGEWDFIYWTFCLRPHFVWLLMNYNLWSFTLFLSLLDAVKLLTCRVDHALGDCDLSRRRTHTFTHVMWEAGLSVLSPTSRCLFFFPQRTKHIKESLMYIKHLLNHMSRYCWVFLSPANSIATDLGKKTNKTKSSF